MLCNSVLWGSGGGAPGFSGAFSGTGYSGGREPDASKDGLAEANRVPVAQVVDPP